MNYLGRARDARAAPLYEATYELNASLQISVPEFAELVAHEVVPGHVTTFALAQALHVQGKLGFEATVLTMNTRGAALFEGIANNAILMAVRRDRGGGAPRRGPAARHAARLLQDDAKNQSLLAHLGGGAAAGRGGRDAAERLPGARRSGPTSSPAPGAATRCSGACTCRRYRAGTEKVAELRRAPPAREGHPGALSACTGSWTS